MACAAMNVKDKGNIESSDEHQRQASMWIIESFTPVASSEMLLGCSRGSRSREGVARHAVMRREPMRGCPSGNLSRPSSWEAPAALALAPAGRPRQGLVPQPPSRRRDTASISRCRRRHIARPAPGEARCSRRSSPGSPARRPSSCGTAPAPWPSHVADRAPA